MSQCHVILAQHNENMETVSVGLSEVIFVNVHRVCGVYTQTYWKRNSL